MNKKELLEGLEKVEDWNSWRELNPKLEIDLICFDFEGKDFENYDLSYVNFINSNCKKANFKNANCEGANFKEANCLEACFEGANCKNAIFTKSNFEGANFDFCGFPLRCGSLEAKLDQKHIVQLLYHAAMPTQKTKIELDGDVLELFNSKLFKKVANKFHRVEECESFTGTKNGENNEI